MHTITRIVLFTCCLLLVTLAAPPSLTYADHHKGGKNFFGKHHSGEEHANFGRLPGGEHDEGNETTGQIVAWSLAVANLTVVFSLLIKAVRRFAPGSQDFKNSMMQFNNFQKRHLMVLHCALNPLILGIAIVHWTLSRCKATALPEWGLLVMSIIVVFGIVLKFELCPKGLLRTVYKIHTRPALPLLFPTILLIGHLLID